MKIGYMDESMVQATEAHHAIDHDAFSPCYHDCRKKVMTWPAFDRKLPDCVVVGLNEESNP